MLLTYNPTQQVFQSTAPDSLDLNASNTVVPEIKKKNHTYIHITLADHLQKQACDLGSLYFYT